MEVSVGDVMASRVDAAKWVAYARGSEALTFDVRKRRVEEHRVELPLRLRGSVVQLFGLGEDSTSFNAEVEIEVLAGAARQVRMAAPPNIAINHVPSAIVADWDVKDGELVVNFLEPVERSAKFALIGEAKLAREGAIDIPLLRL